MVFSGCYTPPLVSFENIPYNESTMKTLGRILLIVCVAAICAIYIPIFIKVIPALNAVGWQGLFDENTGIFTQFLQCIMFFLWAIVGVLTILMGKRNIIFGGYCLGLIIGNIAILIYSLVSGTKSYDALDYIGLGFSLLVPVTGFLGNLFIGKN